MPYIRENLHEYQIFPIRSTAEHIPSMSEHQTHLEWCKKMGIDKFDSGIEAERKELKLITKLIEINFEMHGDVRGIAILKTDINEPGGERSE